MAKQYENETRKNREKEMQEYVFNIQRFIVFIVGSGVRFLRFLTSVLRISTIFFIIFFIIKKKYSFISLETLKNCALNLMLQ